MPFGFQKEQVPLLVALPITPDHFTRDLSPEAARALFKASVKQVEIETFSYCNRTCWFCPNAWIDRRSVNHYMDEALYLRVMGDLAGIFYAGNIAFSRYNEPLADPVIITRIRQARERLPRAHLYTHSNGDYLTREMLDLLRDAGLNALRVQVYLGPDDRFDDRRMIARLHNRLGALGLPSVSTEWEKGLAYSAKVAYGGVDVIFEARNFDAMGNDRGQTVNNLARGRYERTSPCMIVFENLYIDWNGAVVPCCNIRSDEPSHAGYIVDNLMGERSIFDAYARSALVEWRKRLLRTGPKANPCATCSHATLPESLDYDILADEFGLPL